MRLSATKYLFCMLGPMLSEKNKLKERFEAFTKDKIVDTERMYNSYSNIVYMVDTGNKKYIYKEYTEVDLDEQKIISKLETPKILVMNDKYRIEEYIEHEPVDYKKDLIGIVRSLKNYNNVEIQEIKCLDDLFVNFKKKIFGSSSDFLLGYKDSTRIHCSLASPCPSYTNLPLLQEKIEDIMIRITAILKKPKYREGLCHNDLHLSNMLKSDGKIILIDYEYSTIGDVLFDIANLFCETKINYETFQVDHSMGYSESDEEMFLEKYMEDNGTGSFKAEKENIMLRITEYKNVSHFLWFLWAIPYMQQNSNNKFGYDIYALSRLRELKNNQFISEEEYCALILFASNNK